MAEEFKVWYRTKPDKTFGQDNGTLTVDEQGATLVGKKETITMTPVKTVGPYRVGGAFNNWVDIGFESEGQESHVYLTDRRFLGWGGMLGGNDKITSALKGAGAAG
jgi:hypothetical protein